MSPGDVSSDLWSLPIEEDDGLAESAGVGDDDEDGDGGGMASDFLVLAESDAAVEDEDEEEAKLAAVGWTASGVVVLVFVGAVVAWM